ncbi:hypothetical protein QCN29_26205 [Streptomyces sp. HNM0663]|uniref:Secreted protein/lipoprotein n=1 Tax=Streptomyces chengmaiensis TaxID=3040919 RepID=A0ABT6HU12_9ACTN|nr:hypothetical protein [Streptomyces chengmaiensis]MDH2392213.1 hypothetical protein [Streptomyces chengmaiensis]
MTAVSACSSNDSKGDDPKASPTPSATQSAKPADPTETAKKDAIASYQAYWREMEKLYADRSRKSANLKQYAAAAALTAAESDAKRAHDRNRIHIGEVVVENPTVTKADINREIPNVTLASCLDISRWQVVDATTKKPVTLPSNRLTKYVIVTTVERWPEGWRVIRDEPQDKSC